MILLIYFENRILFKPVLVGVDSVDRSLLAMNRILKQYTFSAYMHGDNIQNGQKLLFPIPGSDSLVFTSRIKLSDSLMRISSDY